MCFKQKSLFVFFNLSVMSSVVQVICQKPNKSESDSLFDVIFFSPKSKSTSTSTNETEAKNVTSLALTFDDGPAPGLTPRLVRLLARLDVKATFFMVGSRVRSAPNEARLVARNGHVIANHAWSHSDLTRLGDSTIRNSSQTAALLSFELDLFGRLRRATESANNGPSDLALLVPQRAAPHAAQTTPHTGCRTLKHT